MSTIQQSIRSHFTADASAVAGGKNVGETERLISAASGALLLKLGLHHRGLSGLAGIALGAVLIKRGYTGDCGVYRYLGVCGTHPATPSSYFDHGIHVTAAITVDKPAAELYDFWHKFQNLPAFMGHLKSVTILDDKRSRWVAKGPMNSDVTWNAEIINDVPGELIAWRSLAGAQVDNAGSVRFLAMPDGGTEVRVSLDYIPPGRSVGKWVAKMFGEEPEQQIQQDLAKFKQLLESGVVMSRNGHVNG